MTDDLDRIDAALSALDAWAMDDALVAETTTDDLVELWRRLELIAAAASQTAATINAAAGSRLLDRDDPRAVYVTDRGTPVHLAPGYARVEWRGRALIQRLGRPMRELDPHTGELTETTAVPVPVLLDVLPGVADYDATSSRWNVTGLRRHLPEWPRFRDKHDAPLVLRLVK